MSRSTRSHRKITAGFTLLELVLCLSVISTLIASLGAVLVSSHDAFVETMATSATDEMAGRALDRIAWELCFADPDTIKLAQPTDSPSVTYSRVEGWSSGAPVLSKEQTASFSSGKVLLNGVPIADGVKTFHFNRNGRLINVLIEVERSAQVSGATRTISRRLETRISL